MNNNWEREVAATGREDQLPPWWLLLVLAVAVGVLLSY